MKAAWQHCVRYFIRNSVLRKLLRSQLEMNCNTVRTVLEEIKVEEEVIQILIGNIFFSYYTAFDKRYEAPQNKVFKLVFMLFVLF